MAIELKDLEFAPEDFDLMYEALLYYPEKDKMGSVMQDLLTDTLLKPRPGDTNPGFQSAYNEAKRKREEETREQQKAKTFLVERIRYLQAKLIMMKRLLEQEGALKEAKEIVRK